MPLLTIRLTDDEMSTAKAAASRNKRNLSAHVRVLLFGEPVVAPQGPVETVAQRSHRTHLILERAAHVKPRKTP
jgi:hypothetical protein